MKIVCDSCGAKYSIADEKVAGRVFKIRCKKCGSAIVVRGDQSSAAPASGAPAGYDYGGEAVWHVVVEGDQQGPMAPAQVGQLIADTTIAWDAYVWREGFDDWKPAQEVEELVQQIMNPGGAAGAVAETAASTGESEAQDPFAATAVAGSGADLFAQSDNSAFAGGAADDDDVVASPSPRVSASQAMTGARNENSVLFSLSNLQALATGGSGEAAASAPAPAAAPSARPGGMATGEGSGLIDIRALAGAASSAPSSSRSEPARVDDLLSIGSAGAGIGSGLGAPVVIPEKKEDSSGRGLLMVGGLVAVAIFAGASVIAYGMMSSGQADPAASGQIAAVAAGASASGAIAPGPASPAVATPSSDDEEEEAEAESDPAEEATPAAQTQAQDEPEPADDEDEAEDAEEQAADDDSDEDEDEADEDDQSGHSRRSRRSRRSHRRASSNSATPATPSPSSSREESSPQPSRSSRRGGGGDNIDDLLNSALRGGGGSSGRSSRPSSPPAETLPEAPGRDDVITAMRRVQGAVGQCGGGQSGTATVRVVVAGRTGRVSNATVGGQFQGTPVASCIARAVRRATFPRFSRSNFSFEYPFRL